MGVLWLPVGWVPPISSKAVRFAAGNPSGASSNSWRLWVNKNDAYLACRDNFAGLKLSLHQSGLWRFGWTTEGAAAHPHFLAPGQDRVWEKWDMPTQAVDGIVPAFQLLFPASELLLTPAQRTRWPQMIYADMYGDASDMTVISVFLTEEVHDLVDRDVELRLMARLPLATRGVVQLTAHRDDASGTLEMLNTYLDNLRSELSRAKIVSPATSVVYLHGHRDNGTRFFLGARLYRDS